MPGTTPVYGFPYPEPTDLVADYPALGQQLAEDIEAVLPDLGGLIGSPPTTIANSGGTATLSGNTVTFTTVSSVSLNGCFTGDYDNYRVLITGTGSADPGIYVRLRASGSDATGSNYSRQLLTASSTTVSASRQDTTFWYPMPFYTSNDNAAIMDLCRPFLAARTVGTYSVNYGLSSTTLYVGSLNHTLTTSYDGITIYPSSGTITGIISVYGYKN